MRRVYDDAKYDWVSSAIMEAVRTIDPASVSRYEHGDYRAQSALIQQAILRAVPNIFFGRYVNTTGIGNNACWEVVCFDDDSQEQQICAVFHSTNNMFGGQICWVSDIDGRRATGSRTIFGTEPKQRKQR